MLRRTPAPAPDARFALFDVEVRRVERVSEGYRRLTFAGPDVASIADNRHDQRIKLLLPQPGQPQFGLEGDWYDAWRALPTEDRPVMRTYTIREVRQAAGELDVDVAVHGRVGPASRFALDAEPGDVIHITAPHVAFDGVHGGVDWHAPAEAERLLLVGDETAAPAIAGILERLPADATGIAVVELPHADDLAVLGDGPEGVEVRALIRGDAPAGTRLVEDVPAIVQELLGRPGASGAAAQLEDVDLDAQLLWEVPVGEDGGAALDRAPLYAWLAGESSAIKTLRRHLVSECGIDRRSVAFMGYWRAGRAEN